MKYNKIIIDSIEREIRGIDYQCPTKDQSLLVELFKEISRYTGIQVRFLAEIDLLEIKGAGTIIDQYITAFSSESVKAYLIPHMVLDKVSDCDKKVLALYLGFKTSSEYVLPLTQLSPAHICVRYDAALRKLRPKRLTIELGELICNPRDAFNLPFTVRMLSSWKVPDVEKLLLSYLSPLVNDDIVGGVLKNIDNLQTLAYMERELLFTAIYGLRHYPSTTAKEAIERCANNPDPDIRSAAKKTLSVLLKK